MPEDLKAHRPSTPAAVLVSLAMLAMLAALTIWTGCGQSEARSTQPVRSRLPVFRDVAPAVGITHQHHKPVLDSQLDNIMSWMTSVGAAVAAGDFDNDGWVDFYVTNSRKGEPNYLYKNNGHGADGQVSFTDMAADAGLSEANGDIGTSMDAVWGDYDNDGWIDLYLVRWGRDSLYRNDGPGENGRITFTEVSETLFRRRDKEPGLDWANGNAAIFFDYDRDGRLDIYVGNYFQEVDLWNLASTRIMHDDFERARNGGRNFLYHQEVDGTFTEVASKLGLDDPGWTLAVGSADLNADGWPDLYNADDFGPDQLFVSNGDGTFTNASETALGFDTKKGMNVDFGDFNNDGRLDIYVTNITTAEYLQEGNMLWLNEGVGEDGALRLTDISLEAGTYDGGWGWGAKFFDFDNDTDLDIVSVNGFISAGEESYWYDLASWTVTGVDSADSRYWPSIGNRSFSGYEKARLFRNDGLYSFVEEAEAMGVASTRDGRGVAAVDYDNDGDLDLFIANQNQAPHLYRNEGLPANHWLVVDLETHPSAGVNRDGIGTRVTLSTPGDLLVRERDGGNGYAAQSDPRLHFGLGSARRVDLLEVRWPDGGFQYLKDVEADQVLRLRQNPALYTSQMAIEIPSSGRVPRARPHETGEMEVEPEDLGGQLTEMEERLRSSFDRSLAGRYRSYASRYGQQDRVILFFEKWVKAGGADISSLRIELSLAYVDSIPACGGLAAIVCKGSQARKGLDQLDLVLKDEPDSWLALYARGMNHLHWPRALRHSDDAAADLERCVDLQEGEDQSPKKFYQRTYVALGQAYAKGGRYEKAREAWRRGLEIFPDSEELKEHLAIDGDEQLLAFVKEKRSLERPIDTDLSFFDGSPSKNQDPP